MDIILNQIALWRPCGTQKLNKRIMPEGQPYRTPGSGVYLKSDKPIIRYCKDYTIGKGKSKLSFCLFVRTDIDNDTIIESQLDSVSKTITTEEVLSATANATLEDFRYLAKIVKMGDE